MSQDRDDVPLSVLGPTLRLVHGDVELVAGDGDELRAQIRGDDTLDTRLADALEILTVLVVARGRGHDWLPV